GMRSLCSIGSTALACPIFGDHDGSGRVASGSGPGAFLSEILKKVRSQANRGRRRRNFEECVRHRRASPSHAVRSVCEHSNPQGTKASAAGAVAETPQNDGASQESATPKPEAVRRTPVGGPRNAGVQGGTESSNLLCSSSESVSAVNRRALPEKPRGFAALGMCTGT